MDNNIEVGERILSYIEEKGLTKKSVYDAIGMTQAGFSRALKQDTLSLKKYLSICEYLKVNQDFFLDKKVSENGADTYESLPLNKKMDTKTREFYEGQISSLTRIIENLSEVVKSDTSINGNVTS